MSSNSSPSIPEDPYRGMTKLEDSLYYRSRNPSSQQGSKVNYLKKDYQSLLYRNLPQSSEEYQKQASEIESIIITFSDTLDNQDLEQIITIFENIVKINKQISIILIVSKKDSQNYDQQTAIRLQNILGLTISPHFPTVWQKQSHSKTLRILYISQVVVHGKLWIIKYKQSMRVSVSSSNLSKQNWTVGGNAFWKRDFTIKNQNDRSKQSEQAADFQQSLMEFLTRSTSQQIIGQITQKIGLDFNKYLFDKLDNIHLIISPKGFIFQQQYYLYGTGKIRRIIKNVNNGFKGTNGINYSLVNVISPFLNFGNGNQYQFEQLVNQLYSAFLGIPPVPSQQFNNKIDNQYKKMRIFELTNADAYLANKYELQTKIPELINKKNDLLGIMMKTRNDQLQRRQAFQTIQKIDNFVELHSLDSQQDDIVKYSNFTAHHTKLVAVTNRDENNKRIPNTSEFLFVGSPNFTPNSWGYFNKGYISYCNIQLAVLIQVPSDEDLTDYIPIKFNTNPNNTSTKITSDAVFNLSSNTKLKRFGVFEQLLMRDEYSYAYKRQMMNYFEEIQTQKNWKDFQLCIDYPIIRRKQNRRIRLKHSAFFFDRVIFGDEKLLNFLNEECTNPIRDNLIWIADVLLREKKENGNILAVWYFQLPQFYWKTKGLKQQVGQKLISIKVENIDNFSSFTERKKEIKGQFDKALRMIKQARDQLEQNQEQKDAFEGA